MNIPPKPKRWTEVVRDLQEMQRNEIEYRDRMMERSKNGGLLCGYNHRAALGLPILREGRDADM